MMFWITSNLAAALLAMHSVLVCCWHHAHACHLQSPGPLAIEECASADEPDAHDCCAGQAPEQHRGHSGCECQGGPCTYVRPATENDRQTRPNPSPAPQSAMTLAEFPRPQHEPTDPVYRGTIPSPPTLRLHLAYQVLLI
jgi:hypothetical protein